MNAKELHEEFRDGKVDVEGLICLVVETRKALDETRKVLTKTALELPEAKRRIAELEEKGGGGSTTRLAQLYSLSAEERRRRQRPDFNR